jgi:hypothetical protein
MLTRPPFVSRPERKARGLIFAGIAAIAMAFAAYSQHTWEAIWAMANRGLPQRQVAAAIAKAEKARTLALAAGQNDVVDKDRQLLERFRVRQPYHEPSAGQNGK